MRLPKPSKVSPSPKPNNISRTSSDTEDVSPILNTTEESEEPDKPLSSEKLSEDGPRNQSKSFWDLLITSSQMPTPKTLKTSQLITSKLIELQKEEEEHTEPTVESVPIFLVKPTSNSSLLRRQLMSRRKERPDKLLREKCQLVSNESINIFNVTLNH